MKSKKIFFYLAGLLLVLMLSACGLSNKTKLVDYKVKISNLPYGSENLRIIARATIGNHTSYYEIGTITSSAKDAVIEKVVNLPQTYDLLTLLCLDDQNEEIYYTDVKDTAYNRTTGAYEIDGYWYFCNYYESSKAPYAACAEKFIETLKFDEEYDFDISTKPYLLFVLKGYKNKEIGFYFTGSSNNVDIYASENKADIMTYNATKLTNTNRRTYLCESDEVYFLFRPEYYSKKTVTQLSFTDITFAKKNGIKIRRAVLAPDGNIYAIENTDTSESRKSLWCINPNTKIKTLVKAFEDPIYCLEELDPGIIYVSHGNNISKLDIQSGTVSQFVTGLTNHAEAMVNYKNNKIVTTGSKGNTDGAVNVIDKTTGSFTKLTQPDAFSNTFIHISTTLLYFADEDIFVGVTYHLTPRRPCYMKINDEGTSYSTKEFEYDIGSAFLLKRSPIQFISADGKVFTVSENESEWVINFEYKLGKSFKDCYIKDSYIYFIRYDSSKQITTVEKCAVSNLQTVLKKEEFNKEEGIKFVTKDNKLYLLANSSSQVFGASSQNAYTVYLHEITF